MHGPEYYSKTISDLCNLWGNFASVTGLVISLLGFGFGFWGIMRAKKSADQAAEAAREAKTKILILGTVSNFASVVAAMEDMKRLHRAKDWAAALDRQIELRRILVELKDGGGGLTNGEQTIIQGSIEQFKTIERLIEKHVSARQKEPNIARLNDIVTEQITKLHGISTSLKNR